MIKAYVFGSWLWGWNSQNNLDSVIFTNDERLIQIIIDGHRGLSPELAVRRLNCSICGQNYEDCSHMEGKFYDNEICACLIDNMEPLNVTIVTTPEEPKSRVTDMLVVEDNGKSFTWYGFDTVNDDQRFRHIDKAMTLRYITERMALKFSTYFCSNETGKIKLLEASKQ